MMERRRKGLSTVVLTGIAAVVAIVTIAPLWWVAVSALREETSILANISPLEWQFWLPVPFTLANVQAIIGGTFAVAIGNSLLITTVTVVIGLAMTSTAAFGLSAIKFRGQNVLFGVVVVSFLIPFQAIAIPLAGQFRAWGLDNSYVGLILPGIANGMVIFLMRQFFLQVPQELSEAARVDGMGWFGIFWRIYLPLSKPALIGSALLLGVFQWHAYIWPLLIATTPDMQVAPVAIAGLSGQFDVAYGQMFAAALLITLVPAAALLRYQSHFMASIAATGSKD